MKERTKQPIEWVSLDTLLDAATGITRERQAWNQMDIITEFAMTIDAMSFRYTQLTMEGRSIDLVTPAQTKPKERKEKRLLRRRYGNQILHDLEGDCTRYDDGMFGIRLGFAGKEAIKDKNEILEVLSHEYGHTVGKHTKDPLEGELKAYAFASLYMKHTTNDQMYEIALPDSKVHGKAGQLFKKLLKQGIPEELILERITGESFAVKAKEVIFSGR